MEATTKLSEYSGLRAPDAGAVHVLGVRVDLLTRGQLNRLLLLRLREGNGGRISYINVHALNLAHDMDWFRAYLNGSLLTYCDGEGVRWGSRLKGVRIPERIVMTDWIYDVCMVAAEEGARVFLLGTTESNLALAAERLRTRFPKLVVCGWHSGFFDESRSPAVIEIVRSARPDILVVSMGMPKQERWIHDHAQDLPRMLILNGGSAIDYVAGSKRRCPRWMGRSGFEWLFRLVQEPRRLWRRYLLGLPRFFMLLLVDGPTNR